MTLIEVLVTATLLGVAALALIATFGGIQRSIQKTKHRTIAISLCRELMESLKNRPYALLRPTTQTDLNSPGHDLTYVPPELGLENSGTRFDRYNRVVKVRLDSGGAAVPLTPAGPDAGLKRVEVWVEWDEEGERRRYEMASLVDDPNRSRPTGALAGVVYKAPGAAGDELDGVLVRFAENPSRADMTGGAGSYRISTTSGVFTAVATKRGYFSTSTVVAVQPNAAQDFILSPRGVGSISGVAYLRDHLLVSQAAAAIPQPGGFQAQYVELYNPTTAALFIGDASTHSFRLRFASPHQSQDCPDIGLTYVSTEVPSGGFYVIANTDTFVLGGSSFAADAFFTDTAAAGCAAVPDGWAPPSGKTILQPDKAGSVLLHAGSGIVDALGWTEGGTAPPVCEGACLYLASGLPAGEQVVRLSSPAASVSAAAGRAFDSGDNAVDFRGPPSTVGIEAPPRVSSEAPWAPLTGTPAVGAIVSLDDDLSSPAALTSATGYFRINGVATCTLTGLPASWTVMVASGGYLASVATAAPSAGGLVDVGIVALTSGASAGVVTGTVLSHLGAPLPGIIVQSGAVTAATDAAGVYRLLVNAGAGLSATANPGHATAGLSTLTSSSFDVLPGQTVTGVDFTLGEIGSVTGVVTTDGVSPYPGVAVRADAPAGTLRGTGTADGAGRFSIDDLPTSAMSGVGSYAVVPVLDSSQMASPASASVTVTLGAEVSAGTFTVLGALGLLRGTVSDGGRPITTGVLVVATQQTIAGTPPDFDETLRSGATFYYSAHARADGTFSVPVRVSASPYNVYAWYSKLAGETASTSLKSLSQLVDSSTTPVTVSFSWP